MTAWLVAVTFETVVEWFRVVGGIVGTIFAILGGIAIGLYYRALAKGKATEGAVATNTILQQELAAMRMQVERREKTYAEQSAVVVEREKQIAVLNAKTDLTSIMTTLTDLSQRGQVQYADAMTLLTKQGKENHDLLVEAVGAIKGLRVGIGKVEGKVDDLSEWDGTNDRRRKQQDRGQR